MSVAEWVRWLPAVYCFIYDGSYMQESQCLHDSGHYIRCETTLSMKNLMKKKILIFLTFKFADANFFKFDVYLKKDNYVVKLNFHKE